MSEFARRLMIEQRRRLVASLMEFAERQLYADLTQIQRKAYRDKVLAAVGQYHDAALDCLRVTDETSVVNEEALRLLNAIHREVKS